MRRLFQFVIVVILGVVTEISVDFLKCMSRAVWYDRVHPRPTDFPVLIGGISVFILILVLSVMAPEWLPRPQAKVVGNTTADLPHKITAGDRFLLISAFIVAICITGIRYPSLCEETQARNSTSTPIMK
jgi:hypothetical protein